MRALLIFLMTATGAAAAAGDTYFAKAAQAMVDDSYCMLPTYTLKDDLWGNITRGAVERGVTEKEGEQIVRQLAADIVARVESTVGKDSYCRTRG